MKTVITLLLLTLISCKKDNSSQIYSTEKNESEEIPIELPKLADWKELYSDSLVKKRFDEELYDGTTILGVYLQNKIAEQKNRLEDLDFDNYALFFIRDHEQKWKIDNNDLKRIFDIQIKKATVIPLNVEEAINRAYSDTTFITAEKPYLLKDYRDHKNVYSAIQLIKPFSNDHKNILVYAYNLINIKNHLIYGGYYLYFDGKESIESAMKKNDIIISEFIKANEK
ncbi:hypothetical protein [Aquimarina algiphila]|uniref:hypothetical protein n=1 Tax=Aquimarina algiphila TaxID=2047982 RepID=UPI00232B9B21|nr:hypothetical protein [Aquimarina algiphila]